MTHEQSEVLRELVLEHGTADVLATIARICENQAARPGAEKVTEVWQTNNIIIGLLARRILDTRSLTPGGR